MHGWRVGLGFLRGRRRHSPPPSPPFPAAVLPLSIPGLLASSRRPSVARAQHGNSRPAATGSVRSAAEDWSLSSAVPVSSPTPQHHLRRPPTGRARRHQLPSPGTSSVVARHELGCCLLARPLSAATSRRPTPPRAAPARPPHAGQRRLAPPQHRRQEPPRKPWPMGNPSDLIAFSNSF